MPRKPKSDPTPAAVGDFNTESPPQVGGGPQPEPIGVPFTVGNGPLVDVVTEPDHTEVGLAWAYPAEPEGGFSHTVEWSAPHELSITLPDDGSTYKVYAPGSGAPVFVWPPDPITIANTALDVIAKEEGYFRLPSGAELLALTLADPAVAVKVYEAVKSGSVKVARWVQASPGLHLLQTYPGGYALGRVVVSLADPRKWSPEWEGGRHVGPDSDLATAKAWVSDKAERVAGYVVG